MMLTVVSLSTAGFLAVTANVNQVGLHRFYRDRLMEAFMPSKEAVESNEFDPLRLLIDFLFQTSCPPLDRSTRAYFRIR